MDNALYGGIPIPEGDDVSSDADSDINLNLSAASEDEESSCSSTEPMERSQRERVLVSESLADVRRRLHFIEEECSRILGRIEALRLRYATYSRDGCTIAGLAKFCNRVQVEQRNARRALESLSSDGDDNSSGGQHPAELTDAVTRAYLIARCSSITNHSLMIHSMETEPNVVCVCMPVAPCGGSKGKSAQATLDVDVVSCGGLRWVKVRSAALHRTGRDDMDTAAYMELLQEYIRRRRHQRMPMLRYPEVCLLLHRRPGRRFLQQVQAIGVRTASVEDFPEGSPVFPPLQYTPDYICLDTTALVALCSETCYPSSMGCEERCNNLRKHPVLQGQVQHEQVEQAVAANIDRYLQRHTSWSTLAAHTARLNGFIQCASPSSTIRDESPAFPPDDLASLRYAAVLVSRPDLAWLEDVLSLTEESKRMESAPPLSSDVVNNAHEHLATTGLLPNWLVADVSYAEFRWIVETIAGPREAHRAMRLLQCVLVVDTTFLRKLPGPVAELEAHSRLVSSLQLLSSTGKLLARNRVVFSMADALRAVAITSNRQVVSSAREQGLHILVALHPTRSLTEQKMRGIPRRDGAKRPPLSIFEE